MIITAEEARRLTESQLSYVSERIKERALQGFHFIQLNYHLNPSTVSTLRELGFDIGENIDSIYEETPYEVTDNVIDHLESTIIRW